MPQSHFKPLQGGALAILTLALSLATFMHVLDSTIWVHRLAKAHG